MSSETVHDDGLREPTGDDATALADALDQFFYDLRYTAPEMWPQRVSELGARITPIMAALSYARTGVR